MIAGIALIEALFLFAILVSGLAVLSRSHEQALRIRASGDVQLFATAAANALISEDVGALRRVVREVARNRGVFYAAAWDGKGRLLAHVGDEPGRRGALDAQARVKVDGA